MSRRSPFQTTLKSSIGCFGLLSEASAFYHESPGKNYSSKLTLRPIFRPVLSMQVMWQVMKLGRALIYRAKLVAAIRLFRNTAVRCKAVHNGPVVTSPQLPLYQAQQAQFALFLFYLRRYPFDPSKITQGARA